MSKFMRRNMDATACQVNARSEFWVAFAIPESRIGALNHGADARSEEHTSELQSRVDLVCRLLLEKKKEERCSPRSREPPFITLVHALPPDPGVQATSRLVALAARTAGLPVRARPYRGAHDHRSAR